MTFSELGIELKGRTSGPYKTQCPQCSHTRKDKKGTCLSVNVTEGLFNCHNCGWNGTTKEKMKMEKTFKIPEYNNTGLSDATLKYFTDDRKISKATVMRYKISEGEYYLVSLEKKVSCIQFPYFRDEKIVNIKYRHKRNFQLSGGAELIFFGLDLIKDCKEIIICEGEVDALSFYEAGMFNVVSVPNGASKGSQKLEYLDNCYSYFQNAERFIIATDADEPGIALREELARRLGKEKCKIIDFKAVGDTKDANEVLVRFGKDRLKQAYTEAENYPLEGIATVDSLDFDIDKVFKEGYPKGLQLGLKNFDDHITWRPGQLTTITGIPGSGKSELLNFIHIKQSVEHGWKHLYFSPENQPYELHFIKLSEVFTGKSFRIVNAEYQMTSQELETSKKFINDHFFWIKSDEVDITIDGILNKCREMILRFGINSLTIDPYNYIDHKIPQGYSETQYISELLTKINRFKKIYNIHVYLVAHPTKIRKENGRYVVPTLYDIAGSAHFFNKTDNGITVYRDFETNLTTAYIQKIRFKWIGKIGSIDLQHNSYNNRYTEV